MPETKRQRDKETKRQRFLEGSTLIQERWKVLDRPLQSTNAPVCTPLALDLTFCLIPCAFRARPVIALPCHIWMRRLSECPIGTSPGMHPLQRLVGVRAPTLEGNSLPESLLRSSGACCFAVQNNFAPEAPELSGTPNPRNLLKSIAGTDGRRIAGTNRRRIAGTIWRCTAAFPFLQSLEASKADRYK